MVEAVISVAIAASFILVLGGINLAYSNLAFGQSNKIQASFLAEENLEIVRYLRDKSWNTYVGSSTPDVDYYPYFTGADWKLQSTSSPVGIFSRSVKFSRVYRDSGGNVVSSGGTLDSTSLLVTSTVAWSEKNATSTKVLSTYITDIFDN